jgi:cysteinyl-tRNA synthetase
MHNGLFQQSGEKMSKSLGNFQTIKQVLEKHSADGFRLFLLSSYYRSPATYSEDAMEAAEKGAERLRMAVHSTRSGNGQVLSAVVYRQKFTEAMDDDFGTSQAIAVLFDLARDINRSAERGMDIIEAQQTLKELITVLGLTLKEPATEAGDTAPFIELLIATRKKLREVKQFQLADEIRNKLTELGVALEDSPQGTSWKRKK